jgi:succinylglutamate desuccinylase
MTVSLHHRHPDPGLWAVPAEALAIKLNGPTLIHIPGTKQPELFVSVLLHGDENSGWDGVRQLLRELGPTLPRAMTLMIGNVTAAAHRVRHLPNQMDYNRIWKPGPSAEQQLAQQILSGVRERGCFACIDIHNNSGPNPHYCVLTDDAPTTLGLARLFSSLVVFTRAPDTVSTLALSAIGPALTIECGQASDPASAARACNYLKALLVLDELPVAHADELELYRSDVRVLIDERVEFGYHDSETLQLRPELEAQNFRSLPAGTLIATLQGEPTHHPRQPLRAINGAAHDLTQRYFVASGPEIRLREAVVLAMYTTNPDIARQDCLCYFMERIAPLHSDTSLLL